MQLNIQNTWIHVWYILYLHLPTKKSSIQTRPMEAPSSLVGDDLIGIVFQLHRLQPRP